MFNLENWGGGAIGGGVTQNDAVTEEDGDESPYVLKTLQRSTGGGKRNDSNSFNKALPTAPAPSRGQAKIKKTLLHGSNSSLANRRGTNHLSVTANKDWVESKKPTLQPKKPVNLDILQIQTYSSPLVSNHEI